MSGMSTDAVYEVGYYGSNGQWIHDSDYPDSKSAYERVNFLNDNFIRKRSDEELFQIMRSDGILVSTLTEEEITILKSSLLFQKAELQKLHEKVLDIGIDFRQVTFLLQNEKKLNALCLKLNNILQIE
jgi:hypothetical protein